MENAKKFFEEVVKTEEAKVLLAAVEAPKTEEDRIAAYIEIAKKLGLELTAEEIQEYFETASKADDAELDDDELEQLVGGGADNAACDSTYMHKENCWWNDGCDRTNNHYSDYMCKSQNRGKAPGDKRRGLIIGQLTPLCALPYVNKKLEQEGFSLLEA